MIDGRQWHDIDYLCTQYKKIFQFALEDEDFKMASFEKSFTKGIRKAINEWTVNALERKTLLQDMLDSALDERSLL